MFDSISSEQLKNIFTKTDDAICVVSVSGVLMDANPAAERLFGITGGSQLKIWEAIPFVEGNDDLIQLFIDAIAQKLYSQEEIVDYVNNEGEVYNLHVRMTFYNEGDPIYLIVITDLTRLIKVKSAFARYTSPDIADYVLTTEEGQKRGGMTREVSILMSDLRGFTALATTMSAQELITLLNHYFEAMVAVIEEHHGTVIEFLGDGIFVVFGAPGEYPDHADLAVRCAIGMQNAMKGVNAWNKENGYPALEMGIGINSGDAVIGNIGSDKKMKYGCMGSTVNTAGRVESLTVGGQVLITANTASRLACKFEYASEGSFLPKGSTDELKYYEVTQAGEAELDLGYANIDWTACEATEYFFFVVEGKQIVKDVHKGTVTKVSADRKHALLAADFELAKGMNIMLQRGEDRIYAKVTGKQDGGYVICFTSVKVSL